MLSRSKFMFLNEEHELTVPSDWSNPKWSRLWLYNLHYFDDLDAVGAQDRSYWHDALVSQWIAQNPPASGPGWEPYCLSLRIVNWCRYAWCGNELSAAALHSLAIQIRALVDQIETHLLGNHLLANAKALIIGGVFFRGEEADRWFDLGLRHYRRELNDQLLADGGHFERSPMYHNIITGDVLDLLAADRLVPGRLPGIFVDELTRAAEVMIGWSEAMSHEDGEPAFFNDSVMGIAPKAEVLRRQAKKLGIKPAERLEDGVLSLSTSGYVCAKIGPALLFADVGQIGPDYIPGHAHADSLSFELSLHGRRILVNSGISTYDSSPQRSWERGTAAHNTVVVDGRNSSDVWGAFRVARRARPHGVEVSASGNGAVIKGTHDGYRRFLNRIDHTRIWQMGTGELLVEDLITGTPRSILAHWHFHPDVSVEKTGNGRYRCQNGDGSILQVDFTGGAAEIEEGYWAPQFGLKQKNMRLSVRMNTSKLISRWWW